MDRRTETVWNELPSEMQIRIETCGATVADLNQLLMKKAELESINRDLHRTNQMLQVSIADLRKLQDKLHDQITEKNTKLREIKAYTKRQKKAQIDLSKLLTSLRRMLEWLRKGENPDVCEIDSNE